MLEISTRGYVYQINTKDVITMLKKIQSLIGVGDGQINKTILPHIADKVTMITKNRFGRTAFSDQEKVTLKAVEQSIYGGPVAQSD